MKNKILLTSILLLFTIIPKTNAMNNLLNNKIDPSKIRYPYGHEPTRQPKTNKKPIIYNVVIPRNLYANRRQINILPYGDNSEIPNPTAAYANKRRKNQDTKNHIIINPFLKSRKRKEILVNQQMQNKDENKYEETPIINRNTNVYLSEEEKEINNRLEKITDLFNRIEITYNNYSADNINEKISCVYHGTTISMEIIVNDLLNTMKQYPENTLSGITKNKLITTQKEFNEKLAYYKIDLCETFLNILETKFIEFTNKITGKERNYYDAFRLKQFIDNGASIILNKVNKILAKYNEYRINGEKLYIPPQSTAAKIKLKYFNLIETRNKILKMIERYKNKLIPKDILKAFEVYERDYKENNKSNEIYTLF